MAVRQYPAEADRLGFACTKEPSEAPAVVEYQSECPGHDSFPGDYYLFDDGDENPVFEEGNGDLVLDDADD